MTENIHMAHALQEAKHAATRGEVPVGAVVVMGNTVIATASNRVIERKDPTAHAEILSIRSACQQLGYERLPECHLFVTLEPCPMCATAISFARIKTVFFAASDAKGGGILHGPKVYEHVTCHHRPRIVSGLLEKESSQLLKKFFQDLRRKNNETI